MAKHRKRQVAAAHPAPRVLDEAKAQAWLETQGAHDFAVLLCGALVAAYRLGRYGVMEGDSLSPNERDDSIQATKPILYQLMMRVNHLGDQLYVE